jgi:predicted nucleic acid-binding protein
VAEQWIINASPLIVLSRIGQEELFFQLADTIGVPQAVAAEIAAGPAGDRARYLLESGRFPVIATPIPPTELIAWDLGAGETAVMAFALANPGWTAVLDDGLARKCARSFSIPLKGTLGVVLLAKQRGLIPSAAEVLRELQAGGFRLDNRLVREALQHTVGETW